MKKILSLIVAMIIVCSFPVSSVAECQCRVEEANPSPVKNFWGMPFCLKKFSGEIKVGEDITVSLDLLAGQKYWYAASGCARVQLISIGVFGEDGVMIKTDRDDLPAFCFRAETTGRHTLLLTLEKAEPSIKKSNVHACISLSNCEE